MANVTFKVIAIVALAICLVIGVVGLVLPIIPGLLFLALAALIAAQLSPAFADKLKSNPTLGRYVGDTEELRESTRRAGLSLGRKLLVAGLVTLKAVILAAEWAVESIGRLVASNRRARY